MASVAVLWAAWSLATPGGNGAGRGQAAACTFDRAEVSVGYWDRQYRVRQTVEAVRRAYAVHVTIQDPVMIGELLDLMRGQATGLSCTDTPPCEIGDVRLVVEFSGPGCRELFVGERGRVANLTTGTWGKIDEAFRRRFTFFGAND